MKANPAHDSRANGKLRWCLTACVVLAAAAWLFMSPPLGGWLPNLGLPVGYYGRLNKVEARLSSLSNVEILGIRCNRDMIVEDFTFDLRINGAQLASLYFREAPTNPTWELFDETDSLVVRRRRSGSFDTWAAAHDWWAFDLKPGNQLESVAGCQIRSGRDVLTNFGHILEVMQATPPQQLGEPALGRVLYLSIPGGDE